MQKMIERCRVCGHTKLTEIYSLGEQYISGFVDPSWEQDPRHPMNRLWPLTLVLCENCKLLQLAHTAPQELLYSRHYWYKSGTNESMREALKDIVLSVRKLTEKLGWEWSSEYQRNWLDIGANDGTLLQLVGVNEGCCYWRTACEPASNLQAECNQHCENMISDFWAADKFYDGKPVADVVTAIGMFYDLDDPNAFIRDVREVLAPDGIFVAQLMALKHMLELNDISNVCHEHLEYYSYRNLVDLFERNGLEIFRVEENNVNGGSYRLFARHLRDGSVAHDESVSVEDIYWWVKRVEDNRDQCIAFIGDAVASGARVWVYGASTKGNTVLQYYGLDNSLIEAAADRDPTKHGKVTAGTNIPIRSEEEMRKAAPDYLLCLPYAFFDQFFEREKVWWENGGRWIRPIPQFEVI